MNRGKTALKRGVAVASAAAIAIAGAVLAAPAASAASTLTPTSIRSTPIADAALISAATGDLRTSVTDAGESSYSAGTGNIGTIGVGSSAVSSFQVAIPVTSGHDEFAAGDSFNVTLSDNATFSGAPGAQITAKPVLLVTAGGNAGLDTVVGVANSTKVLGANKASVATSDATATTAIPTTVKTSVNSTGSTLTVTLPNAPSSTGTATTYAYLVTVTGVNVTVANNVEPGAVTASADGGTNATTLAYISPFSVGIAKDAGYPAGAKGDVALPDVTVAQTSTKGFIASDDVTLSVSGSQAVSGTDPTFDNGAGDEATATPSATLNLGAGNGKAVDVTSTTADATVTPSAVDNTRYTSYTLSGLMVQGLKAGADVTLTLTAPLSDSGDTSSWAATPDQVSGPSVTISATSTVPRLAGSNRNDTAADIAAAYAKANASAGSTVVLANGTNGKLGIDALAANFLAGAENAPILLTDSSAALPAETVTALKALFNNSAGDGGVVTVYVMGKTDSVSQAAEDQAVSTIKSVVNGVVTKVNVVRVAGDNRYQTSADAATTVGASGIASFDLGSGSLRTAFLASGAVNADALAAGAISAGNSIPVLLADGNAADASVATAIKNLGIQQLIVLGGTDRIADAALTALKTDDGVTNTVRINGTGSYGRYNTAALLNNFAFGSTGTNLGLGASRTGATAYLANGGAGFPDALAVGPLAGYTNSSVYTVPTTVLPDLTKASLQTLSSQFSGVEALGQTDRIADSVVTAAQAAIS